MCEFISHANRCLILDNVLLPAFSIFNLIWLSYVLLLLTHLCFRPCAAQISILICISFLAQLISFSSLHLHPFCPLFTHPLCNSVSWNIQHFNTLFTFLNNRLSIPLAFFFPTIPLKNIPNRCWKFRGGSQMNKKCNQLNTQASVYSICDYSH